MPGRNGFRSSHLGRKSRDYSEAVSPALKGIWAAIDARAWPYFFFLTLKEKVAGVESGPPAPTASTEKVWLPRFTL